MKAEDFTEPSGCSKLVRTTYPNGAVTECVDGVYTYIRYNTGDHLYLKLVAGEYKVHQIITHDGLFIRC